MATAAAQDKNRERHKRYRSDRYSLMLERQRALRECEGIAALAKAEAILQAEKAYLHKHGVRVNWPGKKALEEAYKQTVKSNSSLPLSTSSTSISYSSNITIDPKASIFGGSLPASPRKEHTPLHKTHAIPPQPQQDEPPHLGRLSLASTTVIRGNPLPNDTNNSFNFSFNENSFLPQNAPLTSTPLGAKQQQPQQNQPSIPFTFQTTSAPSVPIAEPKLTTMTTKPFTGFAPSASNSTDSGKYSSGRLDTGSVKTPLSEPFTGFATSKPLFTPSSTTTVTSLPPSTMPFNSLQSFSQQQKPHQQQQQLEQQKLTSVHKLPTRLTPSAPITNVFKPPKVVEEPEATKPHPVAVRWLRLQRDYYRKFVNGINEYVANPANIEARRHVKMEVGYMIDRTLQKRPSDDELNKYLAEFSDYFQRLVSGESIHCVLAPKKTFTFNPKNDGHVNYLIDIVSRRIIEVIKQDPSLMDISKLVHSIVSSKLPTFKKIFRQILTNSIFLIQITSDDLVVTLDEKLSNDPEYNNHILTCLETEKSLLRFLCSLEMHENLQVKNLSDLCGLRLLYELCVACNTLPQVPITTLSVLFEIMQTAGPALTSSNSPYQKEFIGIVFPRLRALVNENMDYAIDGLAVRLAEPDLHIHLEKMHAICKQRVIDILKKANIKL